MKKPSSERPGPSLMGTFVIVVLEKRFCHLTHLLQRAWLMNV